MTLNKIVRSLFVVNTLLFSLYSMKTTNTIASILLNNAGIITGATYFKIHTKDECVIYINIGSCYTDETEFSSFNIPENVKIVSFHNGKGDVVLCERGINITDIDMANYAEKRLDSKVRNEVKEATICQKHITFYNQCNDIVGVYDIYEDKNGITIEDVKKFFKDADGIDLSNLSKIRYFSNGFSVIKQAYEDFCILQ